MNRCLLGFILLILLSCNSNNKEYKEPQNPLFTLMPSKETGINFINKVVDDSVMNIFNYRNFYNGAGVATGDINNDGLVDIYFTANQQSNKLYLNKGNFKFEDITEKVGLSIPKFWSTGVTMVDINADGFLDIYVCNAGDATGKQRANQLFINSGNSPSPLREGRGEVTFKEAATEYNLQDIGGYHTHAAFFDYDADGDLDCYLLNNSSYPVAQVKDWDQRNKRDSTGGDKLLQNNNGKFIDVSEKAGIYGSLIGFGLGVTVGDVNEDMWPDIYVSNDFFEKDYLYINQQNGTFKEDIDNAMQHTSQSSMGADMADINNDGLPDIFSTDMLPEDDYRLKTMTKFDDYDFFNSKLKGNLHKQFLQNCLQVNNGVTTPSSELPLASESPWASAKGAKNITYSEIAQLAGVNATDWSWGALIFDFDNDGWKDIFVSNGIYRDLTNQDYIDFLANENVRNEVLASGRFDLQKFLNAMKSTPLANYGFLNSQKNLHFNNDSYKLGLAKPSFSNGAAYADLDNDGDLDLVVNNVNMESFVYKNNAQEQQKNAFLKIKLNGNTPNTFGIGSQVTVYANGEKFVQQQQITRGFQSSVDAVLTIGLGKQSKIDSVEITWPNFKKQILKSININTTLTLNQTDATIPFLEKPFFANTLFANITNQIISGDILHKEDAHIDFDKERLAPKMLSTEGPKMAVADFNGDGLEDFCVGGAAGDVTKLFFQNAAGKFTPSMQTIFLQDKDYEDIGIEAVDIENDGDIDLLMASGGNNTIIGSTQLKPRLYVNDGKGVFSFGDSQLPFISCNASCIKANDFNGDGFKDVFIGARNVSGQYGVAPNSYLWQNDGKGNFIDVTKRVAPFLANYAMITDAQWADMDGDKINELVLVGDWMPITILKCSDQKFTISSTIKNTNGWWNCLQIADLNNDGKNDIVAGNWGYNSKLKADSTHPASLYINDFDKNGQVECIPTYFKSDGKDYPYFLRGDITAQIPSLKKKFLRYDAYATKTITEIFSGEQLKNATKLQVNNSATSVLLNKGNNTFQNIELPIQAQISCIYSILINDFNADGIKDIFLAGNFFGLKPELGRMDANYAVMLMGNAPANYSYAPPQYTGMLLKGEVRDVKVIQTKNGKPVLITAFNNEPLQLFKTN